MSKSVHAAARSIMMQKNLTLKIRRMKASAETTLLNVYFFLLEGMDQRESICYKKELS